MQVGHLPKASIMSSEMPSQKKFCSGSELKLENGNTATVLGSCPFSASSGRLSRASRKRGHVGPGRNLDDGRCPEVLRPDSSRGVSCATARFYPHNGIGARVVVAPRSNTSWPKENSFSRSVAPSKCPLHGHRRNRRIRSELRNPTLARISRGPPAPPAPSDRRTARLEKDPSQPPNGGVLAWTSQD